MTNQPNPYGLVDPDEKCPASGLSNRRCIMSDLCDCFPDEPDRFGLHPERFTVTWPEAPS